MDNIYLISKSAGVQLLAKLDIYSEIQLADMTAPYQRLAVFGR